MDQQLFYLYGNKCPKGLGHLLNTKNKEMIFWVKKKEKKMIYLSTIFSLLSSLEYLILQRVLISEAIHFVIQSNLTLRW